MNERRTNLLATVTLLGGVALAKYAGSFQREWKTSTSDIAHLNSPSTRIVCSDWWEGDDMINNLCLFLAIFVSFLEVFNFTAFLKSRSNKRMDQAWTIVKIGVILYCYYHLLRVAKFWGQPICQNSGAEFFHPQLSHLQRCADTIQTQYVLGYIAVALNFFAWLGILSTDAVRLEK